MNDIERLVEAIRKNRQDNSAPKSVDENLTVRVDSDRPRSESSQSVSVAKMHSESEQATDTSNDSLLQDISTDFGISPSDDPAARDLKVSPPTQVADSDAQPRTSTHEHTPCIELPIDTLTAAGFITPLTGRGLMTEQYRRIKRPLLKNIHGNGSNGLNNNVIMVTSSVSGEGKTFTAINLAMSLALEKERTVLLVDADVLKNTASGILEVGRDKPGLTDLLAGDISDPSEVILKTNISNFTYLPSGTAQQHANELLSSMRMKHLFDELSSRYHDRIIVLDCPPILQTNEANVIADYAGQVVFVVAEQETSQSFVVEALKQIPEDTYVGIILNKSRKRFLGNDYGYTYDYG